jgi:hypothetical protein
VKALAPEHLQDLRASGLTDEVIAALEIEAVRPHDLRKFPGVTSAYRLPYFDLNRQKNCFERWRLFPPLAGKDGHTHKYHQERGSDPQVYLPPLLPWTTVAADVRLRLHAVESEKKAAIACQRGLFAIGIAGVWNWRIKLDSGERLVIPTVDLFQWTKRSVTLVPDSDVWRPDKLQALCGFFAFGMELVARGATVHFLKLPEPTGAKVGLDDWLVREGGDDWDRHLETIALDDAAQLGEVMAWWQKWRERQATQAAFTQRDHEELELAEVGGRYALHAPKHSVTLSFERLHDARGGVYAELTVMLGGSELLTSVDVGLKSNTAHTNLAKDLTRVARTIPWKVLVQHACALVLARHRHGEPIIVLEPAAAPHVPFLLNPIIYQQHPTLIYAPGGTCKSYLALWFALLVCHGHAHAGVGGVRGAVTYLDWELNQATVGGRLKELQTGHPELSVVRPFYRRCELPLHQEVHAIAAHVAAHHIQLLIVDSVALACGGELSSPEAAITLQRALRKIGCASLTLAHVAKAVPDGHAPTAYGTVFFRELARNVFELSKADDEHPIHVALTQVKNNFGPKHDPLGFALTFDREAGSVRVDAHAVADDPVFEDKLPIPSRIRTLLEDGTRRSSQEIADALDLKLAVVKATLSRHNGRKWHRTGDYHDGKWTVLNR